MYKKEQKQEKRPLTIAIVLNHPSLILPPPPSHSVARVIENQIAGLKELGHRILLLGPENCKTDCEVIPICSTAIPVSSDPCSKAKAKEVMERAMDILKQMRGKIDIVNGHGLDIPGVLQSTGYLEGCPLPNVTTCHSCIELDNLEYFRKLKNPIVSLSYNQRKACPTLHFAGNVHNGLNPEEFPVNTEPDSYLCFLGRMSAKKQPHLAIKLARQLGIPIKLAGPVDPMSDTDYFQSECKPLLEEPGVEYLGELGMQDKISLLSHARLNLHPTGFRDPCPLVPIEAGYCGTPTLAIAAGALPELIEEGTNGCLVEDFCEGVFAAELCLELDRRKVADYVRNRFSRRRMAEEYTEIYLKILSEADGTGQPWQPM